MRIIQSSWTCNKFDMLRSNFGWLSPEYHLMGWTLSCLQLKQFYPIVDLYCDNSSKKILIDILQLPYDNVICNLDKLNTYHSQLWALPKIYAYSQQKSPFLHVDGDVFVWQKFDENLLTSNLIAQNVEAATIYYDTIMKSLESSLIYFPNEIIVERKQRNPILAYNAGIFGGKDINFFREYTKKAFEFVDKNNMNLSKIDVTNFNIFFEQYLFYCLAKSKKKTVNVLIPEIIGDNQYKGFGDFARVPYEKKYLHLLGTYKKNEFVCNQMANRLRQDYPIYYYRIIELFKKNKIQLYKDFYTFIDEDNTTKLVERSEYLRISFKNKILNKESNNPKSQGLPKLSVESILDRNKDVKLSSIQIKDLVLFCNKANKIIKDKFSLLSKDYLYGRDLNSNYYFQLFFEDVKAIYSKKIIKSSEIEIISSKYEWPHILNKNEDTSALINSKLNFTPKKTHSILIPECDITGYSINCIDDLDILLLEIIKKGKTVRETLDELKIYFEPNELNKSETAFEKLIFGRIKQGFHLKSIRILS